MRECALRGSSQKIGLYCVLLSVIPMLSSCARIQEFKSNPWGARVMEFAPGLAWSVLKWTLSCGILAIPVALLVFFSLRQVGGFRWKWKYAKYFRVVTCIVILLSTVAGAAFIGFNEGIYRGLRDVAESPELKKELRPVGRTGADVVGAIYIIAVRTPPEELAAVLEEKKARLRKKAGPAEEMADGTEEEGEKGIEVHVAAGVAPVNTPGASTENALPKDPIGDQGGAPEKSEAMRALEDRVHKDLEIFRNGGWEVDLGHLEKRLQEVKAEVINAVLPDIKKRIREDVPSLKDGKDAEVVDWFIDTFGEMLVTKIVDDKLESSNIKGPILMVWEGLESAARESGNPKTISHDTLSGYLPSRVLYASAVYPISIMARGNEFSLVVAWFALLLLIVLLFQLAEFCRSRNVHGRVWAWGYSTTGIGTGRPVQVPGASEHGSGDAECGKAGCPAEPAETAVTPCKQGKNTQDEDLNLRL